MNKFQTVFSVLFFTVTPYSIGEVSSQEQLSQPARPNVQLLDSVDSVDSQVELSCRVDRVESLLNNGHRVGFGRHTSGGADAVNVTTVTSLADSGAGTLREAIDSDGPRWIIFDESIYGGTIFLNSPLRIPVNTTIDGRGIDMMSGVTLSPTENATHVMLLWDGNVILHGITIDGLGTGATGVMLRTGDDYWVDHVTITGFQKDDALTVGKGSSSDSTSEVTISNYHVFDTSKGFLAGGEIEHYDKYRTHRVTIFNSLLNAGDRNPHISVKGQTHIFNNLVLPGAWTGIDIRHSAVAIAENNVISGEFSNDRMSGMIAWKLESSGRPTGHIFSLNNYFINGAGSTGSINPNSVTPFDIPYSYDLLEANVVGDFVRNNAGAKNASFDLMVCD